MAHEQPTVSLTLHDAERATRAFLDALPGLTTDDWRGVTARYHMNRVWEPGHTIPEDAIAPGPLLQVVAQHNPSLHRTVAIALERGDHEALSGAVRTALEEPASERALWREAWAGAFAGAVRAAVLALSMSHLVPAHEVEYLYAPFLDLIPLHTLMPWRQSVGKWSPPNLRPMGDVPKVNDRAVAKRRLAIALRHEVDQMAQRSVSEPNSRHWPEMEAVFRVALARLDVGGIDAVWAYAKSVESTHDWRSTAATAADQVRFLITNIEEGFLDESYEFGTAS